MTCTTRPDFLRAADARLSVLKTSLRQRDLCSRAAVFGGLLAVSIFATPCAAERQADEAALRQRTAAFVESVESGNATEVAGFWTDQGEYTGGDGITLRGAVDLEAAYRKHFKEAGIPKVSHETDGIRFLSRDTAVVEGTFESTYAEQKELKIARFSILYVREDGLWRMAELRESSRQTTLRDLGWLIGEWSAKSEDGQVDTVYRWSNDESVITMNFSVKAENGTSSGLQVIAPDPATGAIRSWVFQGGGIGEGEWSREGDRWVINGIGLSANGEAMTATNIYTRKGQDSFTYESSNRTLYGAELPDIAPIMVKRMK